MMCLIYFESVILAYILAVLTKGDLMLLHVKPIQYIMIPLVLFLSTCKYHDIIHAFYHRGSSKNQIKTAAQG